MARVSKGDPKAAETLFWSALDTNQRKVLRTVHKEKVSGSVVCSICQDLLQFALRDVDAKVDWIDPKRRTTAFLSKSEDPFAVFRWTEAVQPDSIKFHGDSCELLGDFEVEPPDPKVSTPFSPTACTFCAGKVRLRFVNMLTYPRPIRKFDLLVLPTMTLKALYKLLADEVGFETHVNLRLMVRGKSVECCEVTLAELGWATSTKSPPGSPCISGPRIVISQVLGKQTLAEETKIKNKQFVGDLLFGQPSTPPPATPSVVESTKRNQGAQILGAVVEDLVQRSVHSAWVADCQAREHEEQLLLELDKEDSKNARKERKKGKKKARERQRKEAAAAERRKVEERARKEKEAREAADAARREEQRRRREEQKRLREEEEEREAAEAARALEEQRRRVLAEQAERNRRQREAEAEAAAAAAAAAKLREEAEARFAAELSARQQREAAELAARQECEAAALAEAAVNSVVGDNGGVLESSGVAKIGPFCEQCGTNLSQANSVQARFCWACGAPIATALQSGATPPPAPTSDAAPSNGSRARLPIFASLHSA